MRLPGLGPKTARRIWQELGITTVDALKAAAEAEQLRGHAGIGAGDGGEDRGGARAAAGRRGPAARAARHDAAEAARRRRGAARASGLRRGLHRRLGAPDARDRARPRHHRDGDRPPGARRLLLLAPVGRRRRREGADEGDGRLARRAALRPARRAAGELRQPPAALHRLEAPQRRAARGRGAPRLLGLRVLGDRRRDRRGAHVRDRRGGLRVPRLRVDPARAARGRRRARGRARA